MSALDTQVGGEHYKCFKIQPIEFFVKNEVPFHKADIIKRIMRYDLPTGKGLEDLEKIKHVIDLIIELQGLDSMEAKIDQHFDNLTIPQDSAWQPEKDAAGICIPGSIEDRVNKYTGGARG